MKKKKRHVGDSKADPGSYPSTASSVRQTMMFWFPLMTHTMFVHMYVFGLPRADLIGMGFERLLRQCCGISKELSSSRAHRMTFVSRQRPRFFHLIQYVQPPSRALLSPVVNTRLANRLCGYTCHVNAPKRSSESVPYGPAYKLLLWSPQVCPSTHTIVQVTSLTLSNPYISPQS